MGHSNISIFIPHLGCPFNCIFCNQFKITGSDNAVTPLEVYNILLTATSDKALNPKDTQIAFFGGSFTAIDRKLMVDYLVTADQFIERYGFDSIRISTRPDCIDKDVLLILKNHNVKTIELGIQSLDDDVLRSAKRGHTVKQSLDACALIQEHGFELGMQMMCGLPGDSMEKDIQTTQRIIDIGCKQVRIYPVAVLEDTKLADMYRSGDYTPLGIDEAVDICAVLYKMFTDNDVTVLKIGLHTANGCIAGPFHPAFGELVRSEVFYNELKERVKPDNPVLVSVSPSFISTAIGNRKRNITRLTQSGINVRFKQDEQLKSGEYKITPLV